MIRTKVGLALLTIVLIAAGEAKAQILEILDRGKPVTGVDVSAILDEGKLVVATTGSTGQVAISTTATEFRDGDRVEVWVKRCEDGKVEVILVPEGGDDPCVEEGAEAGEDCGCEKIGLFIWGGGRVTIDIGTGTVTQTGTGETAMTSVQDHSFADLQIGLMFDYSSFYQWEDVACDQTGITSCAVDGGAPGIGAYVDYRVGKSPFGLSLEAHYAKLEVSQSFSGAGLPNTNTADVNSWQFQAAGVYNYGISPRTGWYLRGGYAFMYDEGKFTSTSSTGPQTEDRSESGSRFVVGTGLHFPLGRNWCTRTGVDLTTGFDEGDADTNARWSFAVGYRMNRN